MKLKNKQKKNYILISETFNRAMWVLNAHLLLDIKNKNEF